MAWEKNRGLTGEKRKGGELGDDLNLQRVSWDPWESSGNYVKVICRSSWRPSDTTWGSCEGAEIGSDFRSCYLRWTNVHQGFFMDTQMTMRSEFSRRQLILPWQVWALKTTILLLSFSTICQRAEVIKTVLTMPHWTNGNIGKEKKITYNICAPQQSLITSISSSPSSIRAVFIVCKC